MEKSKILIVEDERIIAFHIKQLLTDYGYEVMSIISTADEAIEFAENNNPDLVLMDIALKGEKDGVYAADTIRERKKIPVIFLTANTDEKTFQRAKITEPYGYITKPFQSRELKTNIEIALYTHSMRKKVQESEEYLYATLKSISDGVIATDNEDRVKFINDPALNLLMLQKKDTLGKNIKEFYVSIDDSSDEALICNSTYFLMNQTDVNLDKSKILIRSNNTQIPIEESINTIKINEEVIIGKIIIFRDVTKKRESQIEIIKSRNYYLSLFEEFPLYIWQLNVEMKYNYFNKTWLKFRKKTIEEEVGIKWYRDVHPEDLILYEKKLYDSVKLQENFSCEYRIKNGKNEYVWFYTIAFPYFDLEKNYKGYIGASFDITNRKIMEEALVQSKVESEQANKAKTKFIAMMSHELRTPMNGILGMTELLTETALSGEQKNYIRILSQSAYSLLNTLNTILDLSKIEAGKIVIEEIEFGLKSMIKDLLESYVIVANGRGLYLDIQLSENLPEKVISDPTKIKQVIANLVNNAIKFTSSGGITVKAEIEELPNNVKEEFLFKVSVTDTGIGIPSEKFDVIFESFRQADDSTTRVYGGTGLGLTICKQICSIMNGKIWLESTEGKGSTFYVHLILKKNISESNKKMIY